MNRPKFIMMCGLVCSGKSYKAQELSAEYDAIIFSSDTLREELYNDINNQEHNQELFVELHRRIKECLRSGKSAIMDATNLNYKKRMAFLNELKNIPCEKICVLMATPYETCLQRNSERERKVPEHAIKRMYMSINIPYWYEGWDDIQIVYSDGAQDSYGAVGDWVMSVMDYDQNNSHHQSTLGEHCLKTFDYLDSCSVPFWEIKTAAWLHDCGKPRCATYINSKGERTEECHYYNHQFAGSYDSLFYRDIDDHLYVAQLIQWHMHPYLAWTQSEKAKARDRKLLGERLFNDILLLNAADRASH